MKKKASLITITLFLIFTLLPQTCFSGSISSSELIKNAKEHDGKLVTYSGEAIGDLMMRGEFAWVNISDGENALGVWMSVSLAKEIKFTGNYKTQGDNLEITGIFNRSCLAHGGDLDIHAQKLRKISLGKEINRSLQPDKKNLIFILFGALFVIWILTLFKHK
jgi:hypothetical protein